MGGHECEKDAYDAANAAAKLTANAIGSAYDRSSAKIDAVEISLLQNIGSVYDRSSAKTDAVEQLLLKHRTSSTRTIIGSDTDYISSNKYINLDETKIYKSITSINFINSNNKWLYNNSINALIDMTLSDHNDLIANLVSSDNIYIDPFDTLTLSNTLSVLKILYYKKFISDTSKTELSISFVNNAANNLYYLWSYDHQSSKYLISGGKNLLIGPELLLDNYNFTEVSASNKPLIRIKGKLSTTPLTYSIKSVNDKFKIELFNNELFIISNKSISFDSITAANNKIKITITINDGKYNYDRVFFINITKMPTTSTALFTTQGWLADPAGVKPLQELFDILLTRNLTQSDVLTKLHDFMVLDNCALMNQLEDMANKASNAHFILKLNATIDTFRSANTVAGFTLFYSTARDAISYIVANTTGDAKIQLIKNKTGLTNNLTKVIDGFENISKEIIKLGSVVPNQKELAVSDFVSIITNAVVMTVGYKTDAFNTISGLSQLGFSTT